MPKYTTELVPTMPLPHAPAPAPAPAAEAATGERTQAPDWRARALEAEARFDSADAELGRTYRDLDAAILRAEAAEAERDRLALEVAALRGAMPDPWMLDEAAEIANAHAQCGPNPPSRGRLVLASDLRRAAAAIATATPTPPAAEAGTGGGGGELLREAADLLDALAPVAGRDRNEAEDLIGRIGAFLRHSAALDMPQEA